MEDTIITFGPYALPFPVALAAILSIVYSLFNTKDGQNLLSEKFKNGIAILLGMCFGVMIMVQRAIPLTAPNVIGWLMFGVLEGAAAVGLYKSIRIQSGKN